MGKACVENLSRMSPLNAMSDRAQPIQVANSRTPPSCARCRNHEIILPLRGHKRFCSFIDCTCVKCVLTADRQKVMARQTAVRRAEEQDRQRIKNGLPVPGKTVPPRKSPPPREPENSCSSVPDTSTPINTPATTSRRNSTSNSTREVLSGKEMWDSILVLLNWCGLPLNTTPLLQIILSEVTCDVQKVYDLFLKGVINSSFTKLIIENQEL